MEFSSITCPCIAGLIIRKPCFALGNVLNLFLHITTLDCLHSFLQVAASSLITVAVSCLIDSSCFS